MQVSFSPGPLLVPLLRIGKQRAKEMERLVQGRRSQPGAILLLGDIS